MMEFRKKPKMVTVLGHQVKIRYKRTLEDYGIFMPSQNKIILADDENWRVHLIHEIFHAGFCYSGLCEVFKNDEQEEKVVRMLELLLSTLKVD